VNHSSYDMGLPFKMKTKRGEHSDLHQ